MRAASYVLDPSRDAPTIEDTWPCLFFGREGAAAAASKAGSSPWARKVLSTMISEADCAIRVPPSLPFEKPGWRHEFYSPLSAEHLIFDPAKGDNFVDPSDGTSHSSPEKRSAWVLLAHERTYRLMRSIGLLYRLTGREAYARWVAEGLRRAAEFFEKMPRGEDGYGALYFQPLYDAQIIMLAAGAHGLIEGFSGYGETLAEQVKSAIFEKGSRSLAAYYTRAKPHNITCYVSAALATVDMELGETGQLEIALSDDPRGLHGLLQQGLRRDSEGSVDGFWFEGTTFYHFYAMFPLLRLREFAEMMNPGDEAHAEARAGLISMARAPLLLTDDDLRLPWLGDLGSSRLPGLCGFSQIYEYAAGVLDPAFKPVLSACTSGNGRPGVAALVFGPRSLGRSGMARRSSHLKASGIAVLRSSDEHGGYYVLLRSGKHGAGHDHLDKLGIVVHALGRAIMPDIGTPGYSLREFRSYCRGTLAHNCPMVDDGDQSEVRVASLAMEGPSKAVGRISDAYEGVDIARSVTLRPPEILIEDSFVSSVRHRYAIVFHATGEMEVQGPVNSAQAIDLPERDDFAYLRERVHLAPEERRRLRWDLGDGMTLDCEMAWDRPFDCVAGLTPANPMTERLGTLVAWAVASRARAVTTLTVRTEA